MGKSKLLRFAIPAVVAFSIFFGFLAIKHIIDTSENRKTVDVYDGLSVRLVVADALVDLKRPPIIKNGEIALDLNTVRRYIDDTVDWDAGNKRLTVTTRDRLVRMKTDSLTAFVNGTREVRLDLPVFEENGAVYLPIQFLSDFFLIRVSYNERNNVVMIDDRRVVAQTAAVVEKDAVIRLDRSIKSPIVKKVPVSHGAGDIGAEADADYENLSDIGDAYFDMFVFEDYDGWYKVRSLDGVVGYIEKKYVAVRQYVDKAALTQTKATAWKPDDGKIIMVWEQVGSARANPDPADIPAMPGLDVVSPTWFVLADKDGSVESRASAEYIEWAHKSGYVVWALFSNNSNDIDMTSAFLNNSQSREDAIRALLAYAVVLGVDGVNLDFENVYLHDRDALTQFVRELAPMLRAQGLTFSVDVNVPDGSDTWSRCYDTPAIADAADYVNLMAYDQYWASSPESGSVSQLSWVEANLRKLIERDGVPPEKILLGIPFYTRVWEMGGGGALPGDKPNGSSAVGMKTAINNVLDNDADIEWDEESGQYYCNYAKDGKFYQVWLEEPNSANLRSALVHKYALAGVSAWSRNFVIPPIWDVLNRNLKEIATYDQWRDESPEQPTGLARAQ